MTQPSDSTPSLLDVEAQLSGQSLLVIGCTGFLGKVWLSLLLDRYRIVQGPAMYRSATAVVIQFVDMRATDARDRHARPTRVDRLGAASAPLRCANSTREAFLSLIRASPEHRRLVERLHAADDAADGAADAHARVRGAAPARREPLLERDAAARRGGLRCTRRIAEYEPRASRKSRCSKRA